MSEGTGMMSASPAFGATAHVSRWRSVAGNAAGES
jgi:hypothetical protein